MAPRLPVNNSDFFTWGTLLNTWLSYDHDSTGSHRPRVPDSSNIVHASVNDGDWVYWSDTSNAYMPAQAGVTLPPVGIKSHSDVNPTVILFGRADTTAVMTPGTTYYLSDTTAGRQTSVAPSTSIIVGVSLSASQILARIYTVSGSSTISGSVTFASASTATVTFASPQPDTSYKITLSWDTNENFWWSNKTVNGFTLNSSNGASTGTVNWKL